MTKSLKAVFLAVAFLAGSTGLAAATDFANPVVANAPSSATPGVTVVIPPKGVVAFPKKDQSSCPTGTKSVSGAPADTVWCASDAPPPPTAASASGTAKMPTAAIPAPAAMTSPAPAAATGLAKVPKP